MSGGGQMNPVVSAASAPTGGGNTGGTGGVTGTMGGSTSQPLTLNNQTQSPFSMPGASYTGNTMAPAGFQTGPIGSQAVSQALPIGAAQPAAAMNPASIVNQAYGNIGKAGIGGGANQIDQEGYNFWTNALQSGAMTPQSFGQTFQDAAIKADPTLANKYQNQSLAQTSGARPSSSSSQFYQPVYQSQYQNYANPATAGNVSQYGTTQGYNPYAQQFMMGPQQQQGYNPYAQQPQQQQLFNPYNQQQYQQPQQQYQQQYQQPQQQYQQQYQQPQQQNTLQLSNAPGQYQQPQQQPQYTSPAALRSSGPSQAIVGRSAQMRGTPNVVRRATGGIVSLLGKK
jgi:hypothetical protein